MGLLTLTSTNPAFSYLLRKNPARTRMMAKPLGKGTLFGWFDKRDASSNQTFLSYFRDGENEVTFRETSDQTFEYLSTLRYTSPRFVLAACTLFFKDAMRGTLATKSELEAPTECMSFGSCSQVIVVGSPNDEVNQTPATSPVDERKSPLDSSSSSSSNTNDQNFPLGDDQKKITFDAVDLYRHTLVVNLVHIVPRGVKFLDRCRKFLTAYKIDLELAQPETHVYTMRIETGHSLQHLLNTTFLLCAFFASFNRHDNWAPDEPLCERLIGIMHTMDAPYYVRYRFVAQFLDRKTFPKMRAALTEQPSKHYGSVEFHEGSTADHRRDMIRDLLDFKRPILEIGCGEGFYTCSFAQRLRPLPFVAIDTDEDVLAKTRHRCITTKGLDNVSFHASLDAFLAAGAGAVGSIEYSVLLSEVIEHVSQEDAASLIQTVLRDVRFREFIITTPNSDFNPLYLMDTPFRHDDHKFELGTVDFQAWANGLLAPFAGQVSWTFIPVGDVVDGIHCSHGLIVTTNKA